MVIATTIDEVIAGLEKIITECINNNNRAGYFATLYLKVTTSVKDAISSNRFQDGKRMEQLDVTFANRYLHAYYQWQNNETPTASWLLAFQKSTESSVLIIEQLLLGISAHINLDLGIATAQTQKTNNKPLQDIHADYDTMNDIIASLTFQAIAELDKVSPLLSLLGFHAGNTNSVLIQFSIVNARDGAWCFAEELYAMGDPRSEAGIYERDRNILQLGESIVEQTGLLAFTIWAIHLFEWKNPAQIIAALSDNVKKHFTIGKARSK